MAVTTAKLPATLLRAVRSYADERDAYDDDGDGGDAPAQLPLGVLLGAQTQSQLLLCGLLRAEPSLGVVAPLLPGGVAAIGHLALLPRAADTSAIEACARRAAAQRELALEGFVLVLVRESATAHLFHATSDSSELRALALEVVPNAHARDFLADAGFAFLRAAVDICGEEDARRWRAQLNSSLNYEETSDEQDELFFRVAGSKSVYDCAGADVSITRSSNTSSSKSLSSILLGGGSAKQSQLSKTKKSAKKKNNAALDAWDGDSSSTQRESGWSGYIKTLEFGELADVEVLRSLSPSDGVGAAPTLTITEVGSPSGAESAVELRADVLVLVSTEATVSEALGLVREQLCKQLDDLERRAQSGTRSRIEAHHFALVGAVFPITLLMSPNDTDRQQQEVESVRDALLQPAHQPLFDAERCSLVTNSEMLRSADVLFNVHEGIPSSGVANGEQSLVAGFYGYYHYMQQGMNDKGWGCAYRSLQTLASWLQLQHYTSKASLTHEEIQRTLVRIGDKPPSFVGSREWIGSVEVGYVLDELFGVTFRTLSVSSGANLAEKAQELKHHFETQGTPVMMGGGSLAFTLLGIDYNAASGECAFLILDPHYTGGEDLDVIQHKPLALEGYKAVACGWRRASTFAKSFYNLCLPQRPQAS